MIPNKLFVTIHSVDTDDKFQGHFIIGRSQLLQIVLVYKLKVRELSVQIKLIAGTTWVVRANQDIDIFPAGLGFYYHTN